MKISELRVRNALRDRTMRLQVNSNPTLSAILRFSQNGGNIQIRSKSQNLQDNTIKSKDLDMLRISSKRRDEKSMGPRT
ncbi:MAG: hypothetical protein A2X48_07220 [Lentisphaerae bacterium GWF2_49_21]|nr:MAG: hypothetical protein A2X48_07220 [Lentisphaerae bacterium GWF2_49_21]